MAPGGGNDPQQPRDYPSSIPAVLHNELVPGGNDNKSPAEEEPAPEHGDPDQPLPRRQRSRGPLPGQDPESQAAAEHHP